MESLSLKVVTPQALLFCLLSCLWFAARMAAAAVQPSGASGLSSADGLIALLDEDQQELKAFALDRLNDLVDQFWAEIAEHIAKMYVAFS